MPVLSLAQLREFLSYNPETGAFAMLRTRQGTKTPIGADPTSWDKRGRGAITLLGRRYGAHQLAFLHVHGYIPDEIDHINGNPSDNRIANLREVSHQENLRNCKTPKSNTSGHRGVRWRKDRHCWQAFIIVSKKWVNLGHFQSFDEACKVRKAAEKQIGFHANHGRTAAPAIPRAA